MRLFISFMCHGGYGNAVLDVEHEPQDRDDISDLEGLLVGHKTGWFSKVRGPHILWWKVLAPPPPPETTAHWSEADDVS